MNISILIQCFLFEAQVKQVTRAPKCSTYGSGSQEECDFILENFDDRAADRAGEMEGLTRAKELLSGASLVQEQKTRVPLETKDTFARSCAMDLSCGSEMK